MNDIANRPQVQTDQTVDLHAVFAQLRRKRWWIVAGVIISTLLFYTAAKVITPVYRATAVLIPVSAERSSMAGSASSTLGQLGGGLATLAGLNVGTLDPETEEAMGVLRARQFTEKFIVDQNLLPQLYASKWDPRANTWKTGLRSIPTVGRAFKYFNKSIRTVIQDNKTGLISVQVDWRNREAAAAWANELVRRVNAEMRKRAVSNADASIAFLEKELMNTSVVEVREAINRLIETQEKQKMIANVTEEYAFRVVDPAIAPDADDPVRPPKLLLFIAGPIVGLLLSIACVLIFGVGASLSDQGPATHGSSI